MLKRVLCVLLVYSMPCFFIIAISSPDVLAGGGQQYPNGAEAFMVGAMPPPGLTLINYAYYGHASDLKDDDGDDTKLLDDADIYADIVRLIWVSKKQLWGANYGQHFFFGVLGTDLDFNSPVGSELKKSYSDFNLLYAIYSPMLLGWHLKQGRLHIAASLCDIYIPFYNEDEGNIGSVGRNFWTIEPVLAATYLPTPTTELSIKFMYDFNTKQHDYEPGPPASVDRTPGQEFHFDFNLGYAVTDKFKVGLSGYYYMQTTKDDYDSIEFSKKIPPAAYDSVRAALDKEEDHLTRAMALGPGFIYMNKNFMASLRYQHEFAVRNKPEMRQLWFKLIYIF